LNFSNVNVLLAGRNVIVARLATLVGAEALVEVALVSSFGGGEKKRGPRKRALAASQVRADSGRLLGWLRGLTGISVSAIVLLFHTPDGCLPTDIHKLCVIRGAPLVLPQDTVRVAT
jgi:hypothetical protein